MEEIEAKFLDINSKEVIDKLESLGAKRIFRTIYRRRVFDFSDLRLKSDYSWLRLRDEGDKVTLAYKKRFGVGDKFKDSGMNEIEINVSSFEDTAKILLSIGMIEKFYEENERIKYILGDIEFCIDTWPLIPTYLEIEGKDWGKVEKAAINIGLDWEKHIRCSTMQIYKHYGIDESSFSYLTFDKQIKK